jgi:hypothetical protein
MSARVIALMSEPYGTALTARITVYAHLDPKQARSAANRIDAALGRTLPEFEDVAKRPPTVCRTVCRAPADASVRGSFMHELGAASARRSVSRVLCRAALSHGRRWPSI